MADLSFFKLNPLYRIMQTARNLICFFMAALLALLPAAQTASAQQRSVGIIRDAEIEDLIADYTKPILRAAGLSSNIQIVIVNDPSFNAFVDGRRIFVNIGTLMQAGTPNEVIGVIAHETAHLAGGHQHRLREELKRAQTLAIIGMLVGIGAGVAGATSGNRGAASAAGGIAAGSSEIATRYLLNYQRSEEAAADRAAINYLNKTGQSAKGMLTTFERFSSALSLSSSRVDPYRVSHPLPRERIAALETLARKSPYFNKKDPTNLQMRHDMMRAKIAANTGRLAEMRRMFQNNPHGLPARYGDAIMAASRGAPKIAVQKASNLIKEQPSNPFFQELLGDAQIKANNPAAAANAYRKASELHGGRSSLLRINYGHALLLTNNPAAVKTAIAEIQRGLTREPEFAAGYGYLAMAYGRVGDVGLADLATADRFYYSGDYQQARIFATRAQQKLKRGAPGWVRAQDILNAAKGLQKKR